MSDSLVIWLIIITGMVISISWVIGYGHGEFDSCQIHCDPMPSGVVGGECQCFPYSAPGAGS